MIKEWLWNIERIMGNIKEKKTIKKYQKKYPDYVNDEYNCGPLKFIWGVKSWDDMSASDEPNMYTMNDLDLCYDRDTHQYLLSIETVYLFKDINAECEYYLKLLHMFTEYMVQHGISTKPDYCSWCANLDMEFKADSIEELYTRFQIVVIGFCKVHDFL